jgi:hypothetical protein
MWDNDYGYQRTLIDTNETSPYETKRKSTKFKVEKTQVNKS